MATKDTQKKDASSTRGSSQTDAGQAEIQATFDEAAKKGYFGSAPDPTPNENYSLRTPPDAPTPETDPASAREARKATGLGVGPLERRLKDGE